MLFARAALIQINKKLEGFTLSINLTVRISYSYMPIIIIIIINSSVKALFLLECVLSDFFIILYTDEHTFHSFD